jgi:hypothetical protein
MAEVKAQFPIGKTQWAKWSDVQRGVFNLLRDGGMPHDEAIKEASCTGWVEFKPEVVVPEEPVEAPEAVARFETVEGLMADLNDEPAPKKPAPQKKAK